MTKSQQMGHFEVRRRLKGSFLTSHCLAEEELETTIGFCQISHAQPHNLTLVCLHCLMSRQLVFSFAAILTRDPTCCVTGNGVKEIIFKCWLLCGFRLLWLGFCFLQQLHHNVIHAAVHHQVSALSSAAVHQQRWYSANGSSACTASLLPQVFVDCGGRFHTFMSCV